MSGYDYRCGVGPVYLSSPPLLPVKNRQSRRGERGLVIPNERAATTSDGFSRATRRAESLFASSRVIARLCSMATLRSLCLAGSQTGTQQ